MFKTNNTDDLEISVETITRKILMGTISDYISNDEVLSHYQHDDPALVYLDPYVDSIDMVEIVLELEEQLSIVIDDGDMDEVKTLQDIIDIVLTKCKNKVN